MRDRKAYTLKPEVKVRRENRIKMTFEMPAGTPVFVSETHDGTYFMVKGRDGNEKDDPYGIGMINNRAVEGVDFTFKKP